jgi:F-type H+-transporting ATPase subunit a
MLILILIMFLADEFEPPKLDELMPDAFLFQGTWFAFNRIDLIRVVAVVLILLVFGLAARKSKVVPSKFQVAVEYLFDYVKKDIVGSAMTSDNAPRYYNLGITIFSSILVFNLMGVIPGLNLAATSGIGLPLMFAIWVFTSYWRAGIKASGFFGFLKHEMFPPGVPWPVYILLAPIELLQLLIIRPFSLTLRLFANMMSGHMILGLCFAATQFFVFSSPGIMKGLGLLTFPAAIAMTGFEMFVAFLQAMIFTTLGCSYIQMSIPEHQAEEPVAVITASPAAPVREAHRNDELENAGNAGATQLEIATASPRNDRLGNDGSGKV